MSQASSLELTIPEKDKKIIRLYPDVKKELDELVEYKGETYNDIVRRLIKHYKATTRKK
jgi:predicted DNA-binding protein